MDIGPESQGQIVCGTCKVNLLRLISHAFVLQISYALVCLYVGVSHRMVLLNLHDIASITVQTVLMTELFALCCLAKQ
jgi:hypothetical protein